jgi:hypothetical protein
MATVSQNSKDAIDKNQLKARILLALSVDDKSKKTTLRDRILGNKKNKSDFDEALENLQQEGVIEITKTKGSSFTVSLKGDTWQEVLGAEIEKLDFKSSGTVVGTWMAKALVNYISHLKLAPNPVTITRSKISSYDEFKPVALETYAQLNQDYNFDNLVPIYRIRRAIGEQVTRSQFNEWLLEMQSDDIFQLQGGGVEDDATDKLEDSIQTKVSGLRCFAKRIDLK